MRVLGLRRRLLLPAASLALARLIRQFQPTVVHAHLFLAGLCVAATRSLNGGAARIVTFHNLGYDSYPVSSLWRRARRWVDGWTMRHGMDAWVAVSAAVREHYARNLGLRDVTVIPNAVDVSELDNRIPADVTDAVMRLQVESARPLLLCAGRFRHEKGHRFLIEALEMLKRRGLDPVLVLAGDGPLLPAVTADVVQRNLEAQVRVLGRLDHRELMDLMAGVDVVVLPSTHEGLPVTLVEAMVLRKPVVASRVGGIPELIDDEVTGILVPPADVPALAAAIQHVLRESELRARLGTHGRTAAEQLCGLDRVIRAHETLFAATRLARGAAVNYSTADKPGSRSRLPAG